MADLVEWLTNILNEDEAGANAAVLEMGDGDWSSDGDSVQTASGTYVAGGYGDYCDVGQPAGSFIARHDPASVLADIAAKRAILAQREQVTEDLGEAPRPHPSRGRREPAHQARPLPPRTRRRSPADHRRDPRGHLADGCPALRRLLQSNRAPAGQGVTEER